MKYTAVTVILNENELFEPPEGAIGITIIKDYEILIEESEQIIMIDYTEKKLMLESRVPIWKINYLIPVVENPK